MDIVDNFIFEVFIRRAISVCRVLPVNHDIMNKIVVSYQNYLKIILATFRAFHNIKTLLVLCVVL